MKQYFASADEVGIKKGQRVYPRQEVLKMVLNDSFYYPTLSSPMFNDKDFFGLKDNGEWIFIYKHIPTCIETEDKDAFREWLEKETDKIGGDLFAYNGRIKWYSYKSILEKYDELHAPKPETKEPKPLFEVGSEVIAPNSALAIVSKVIPPIENPNGNCYAYRLKNFVEIFSEYQLHTWVKPLYTLGDFVKVINSHTNPFEIEKRYFENGEWFYEGKNLIVSEKSLVKLPKTKMVFSLEKWVGMAKNGLPVKDFITRYEETKKYSGLTFNEVLNKYGVAFSSDLFVEVEVK